MNDYLTALNQQLTRSEFYWPYLLSGLILILAFLRWQFRLTFKDSIQVLCDKKIWLHRSTALDIILSAFYGLIWFLPANLAFNSSLGAIFQLFANFKPAYEFYATGLDQSSLVLSLFLTIWLFVCIDFASYITHRAMHRWNWFWLIHSVHHATEHLNIFSTHRQHPAEPILLNLARGAFAGIGYASFQFFFSSGHRPIMIAGMGAGFFFYMFTINLHHLHIPIRYPKWLRWLLISPHVHHLHHSSAENHLNKNFGVILSIWDRCFGTYHEESLQLDQLKFGIRPDPYRHRLISSIVDPLRKLLVPNSQIVQPIDQSHPVLLSHLRATGSKLFWALALIISAASSESISSPQINSVTIYDEKCEQTYMEHRDDWRSIKRVSVPLPETPKPFVCTRVSNRNFSCYSNLKERTYNFDLVHESPKRIALESRQGRHAVIEINTNMRRFYVTNIFQDANGLVITEHCLGSANLK